MTSSPSGSLLSRLVSLSPSELAEVLDGLSAEEVTHEWRLAARDNQVLPPGSWRTWLILAGRGFGKTRTGSEAVRAWATGPSPLVGGRCKRIALVAETAADARDVMTEGESGILACHPKDQRPLYEPSKRRLTWPNGCVATLYNGVEPDQLRGPQHDGAWVDELAKFRYARETWDQLQFGLRLGDDPRQVVTTTPKPIPVLREIMADPGTVMTRGSTRENAANLAPAFLTQIVSRYEGTRLGRQEIEAEMLDDVPGALWTRDMIESLRVRQGPTDFARVVVAVDPSGRDADTEGDEQGIVVAGLGRDGVGYVLADASCAEGPGEWGRRVVQAYRAWNADRIVAETNFGGAMVRFVIQTADKGAPVKVLHASRGKIARAEPVSALYEQGRVKHVGAFPALEDQLCAFRTDGYVGGGSPDRADALVWAITELMLGVRDDEPLADPVAVAYAR